jgi:PhnB protein
MNTIPAEIKINEVIPYLRVRGGQAAIDFYKHAFGAEETFRLQEPSGRIGHAQLKIGPAMIMLSDEHPEHGIYSPLQFGGTGSSLHLHLDNVDALVERAVAAGATVLMPPTDQFYGERTAKLLDPFGHEWLLGQHIENVTEEEMRRRFTELMAGE